MEQVAELFASTLLALEQQNNGIARFHAMRGMGLIEKIRAAENVRVVTRSESPLEGEKHFFTNHPLQEIKEDADQEQDTQSLAYADGRTKEASSGEEAT
ncbi:MAG: hypothetical protein MI867_12595 [Pseudomonadales bacterium]|nr:hypothetical protein [Pseudomonadales bacterium]